MKNKFIQEVFFFSFFWIRDDLMRNEIIQRIYKRANSVGLQKLFINSYNINKINKKNSNIHKLKLVYFFLNIAFDSNGISEVKY